MKTNYVLVTPVYNEGDLIEKVMKSVIAQTIRPTVWVIVNDGSTDQSLEIIRRYESSHSFIRCLSLRREDIETYYSRRVYVVLEGIQEAKKTDYDFIGVLDGDTTLEPNYYESILQKFDQDPTLGIATGISLFPIKGKLVCPPMDSLHTPGSIQMFRKDCYDQVGGYTPLKFGGDDTLCEIAARMHGWKTRNFPELVSYQHRYVGTGDGRGILKARFRQGLTEFNVATHPVFMIAKTLRRILIEPPYVIGSLVRLAGYLYGHCSREKCVIPEDVKRYIRKEQLGRVFGFLRTGKTS
jgi:poly-beta-1,6-N-acetyl-D-glucosamine synthase